MAPLASEIRGHRPDAEPTLRRAAQRYSSSSYARTDAPANRQQKAVLAALTPDRVTARELAGEEITAVMTRAPGNDAPIGGLKVTTANAWFAARPSGTEGRLQDLHAESFLGEEHLHRVEEAQVWSTRHSLTAETATACRRGLSSVSAARQRCGPVLLFIRSKGVTT